MLTIRETQDRTGLSDAAIRRHIKSGNIHATQTEDGKYLIEESELAKLPNPRNRLPNQKAEKERSTQDVPFSLERYKAETERRKVEVLQVAIQALM